MRCVVASVLLALAASGAMARDQTRLAVLGFARDGQAFAFEEFGWQSKRSSPYSVISILDTQTGLDVAGAPFSALIAQNDATLDSARLMAYSGAQRVIASLGIGQPGEIVARTSGDPVDPAAQSASFTLPGLGPVSLKLETAVVKSVGCDALGVKVRALAVRLVDASGAALRTLYKEKVPPAGRFCPTAYGVVEVRIFPAKDGGAPILSVIFSYDRPGLGVSERHFFGVATNLAAPEAAESKE